MVTEPTKVCFSANTSIEHANGRQTEEETAGETETVGVIVTGVMVEMIEKDTEKGITETENETVETEEITGIETDTTTVEEVEEATITTTGTDHDVVEGRMKLLLSQWADTGTGDNEGMKMLLLSL